MKKLSLVLATALLLGLAGVAFADEAPAVDAPQLTEAPADAACAVPAVDLELGLGTVDELFETPTQDVCSCIDLCRSDRQCEFQYGPGSVCVVGNNPCGCKVCLAAS